MKTNQMSFATTIEEDVVIFKIIDRAERMLAGAGLTVNTTESILDLRACHANGTPLDFDKFLDFDDFDFGHDFMGIWRHMDRSTGTLKDFFIPRCAR